MTSAGRADSGIDFEQSMIPEPLAIEKTMKKYLVICGEGI